MQETILKNYPVLQEFLPHAESFKRFWDVFLEWKKLVKNAAKNPGALKRFESLHGLAVIQGIKTIDKSLEEYHARPDQD